MIPIVTMVDNNYFPGLLTLLESMTISGNLPEDQEIIIMESEPISSLDKQLVQKYGYNIHFDNLDGYDDIYVSWFGGESLTWYAWLRRVLKKIHAFSFIEYDKVVWIDADMICLGDLNPLFEMEPLSARPDYGRNQSLFYDDMMYCSGCMVLKPSLHAYNGMMDIIQSSKVIELLRIQPSGDQVIINEYFKGQFNPMGLEWGVNKRTVNNPQVFKEHMQNAKLFHFVGFKPWFGNDEPIYTDIEVTWHNMWENVKKRFNGGHYGS